MKNLLYLSIAILALASCGKPKPAANDLAGKKQLLTEKKQQLTALQQEIDALKKDILVLDPPKEKKAQLITTEEVKLQDFERFVDVQASVMSSEAVFASSETGGRLTSMKVSEGQFVKKGQLIATVDLQMVKDQKAELETSIVLAKDVFERQKRLWEQSIGTEIQYLQAKNNYERLQKNIQLLDNQIAKGNVYAPISGIVDREFLQAGEMAGPGTPIVQIFDANNLKVMADIPESYLGKLKRGDVVDIKFPAIDIEIKKHVSLIGRTIDPSNRTFKIEVNTSSLGGKVKPNLLAEVSFSDYKKNDVVTLPLPLVLEQVDGKKYAFVAVMKNGKLYAEKRFIEIGESYQGKVIVESGINKGDAIIVDGARSVTDGDPVKDISK